MINRETQPLMILTVGGEDMKLFENFEELERKLQGLSRNIVVSNALCLDLKSTSNDMAEVVIEGIREHLVPSVGIHGMSVRDIKRSSNIKNGVFKTCVIVDYGIVSDIAQGLSSPRLITDNSTGFITITITIEGRVIIKMSITKRFIDQKTDRIYIIEKINRESNESNDGWVGVKGILSNFMNNMDTIVPELSWSATKTINEALIYQSENKDFEMWLLKRYRQ